MHLHKFGVVCSSLSPHLYLSLSQFLCPNLIRGKWNRLQIFFLPSNLILFHSPRWSVPWWRNKSASCLRLKRTAKMKRSRSGLSKSYVSFILSRCFTRELLEWPSWAANKKRHWVTIRLNWSCSILYIHREKKSKFKIPYDRLGPTLWIWHVNKSAFKWKKEITNFKCIRDTY